MNRTIDLKVKKVRFTELTKLGKRIEEFAKLDLDVNQTECFEALINNFQKGNYHKANDIANMLDNSLSNQCICREVKRNFTIIK
jgi:hypothetical protein